MTGVSASAVLDFWFNELDDARRFAKDPALSLIHISEPTRPY